jgi:hypothetical protein
MNTVSNKPVFFQDNGLPLSPSDKRYIDALEKVISEYPNYNAYYTYFSSTCRILANYASDQHHRFVVEYPKSLIIIIMLDDRKLGDMQFVKYNMSDSGYENYCDVVTYAFKF